LHPDCFGSVTWLNYLLLPAAGFTAGIITVIAVLSFSSHLDHNIHNQTIVLMGMVVSLFVRAILTLTMSLSPKHAQQLYLWMMGSFSSRNWIHVSILLPSTLIITFILFLFSRELDTLTFGEEEAASIGVDTHKTKKLLIVLASLLTGISVSFTGTIGFIDLVAPHAVRKIFGSSSRTVLWMSFFYGGAFMALADLISRTVLAPREIPVGAVTALIGAPFFAYIYFHKSKNN